MNRGRFPRVKNSLGFLYSKLARMAPVFRNDVVFFMYHRVSSGPQESGLALSSRDFESSLLFLQKNYRIVALEDFLAARVPIGRGRLCVVTFDDGWLDNYQNAFPLLRRHAVPATIFLPTGMIGTNRIFWFELLDRLLAAKKNQTGAISRFIMKALQHVAQPSAGMSAGDTKREITEGLKKLHPAGIDRILNDAGRHFSLEAHQLSRGRSLINWDEVREMSAGGISFGSHCVNHGVLTALSAGEKSRELNDSRRTLLEKKVRYVDCVSFPNGNYDQETLDIAGDAGYQLMFSASINECGTGFSPRLRHRVGVNRSLALNPNLLEFLVMKAKLARKGAVQIFPDRSA